MSILKVMIRNEKAMVCSFGVSSLRNYILTNSITFIILRKKSKAMKRRVVLYKANRELPKVRRSSGVLDETSLGAAYGSLQTV